MFSTHGAFRTAFSACLLAASLGAAGGASAASGGLEALAATVPTVGLAAPAPGVPVAPQADCTAGTAERCFESNVGARFVSVSSFFDRAARNSSDEFMVKYFEPAAPGRYRIEGFSFTSNRAQNYAAGGAIVTPKATPFLPSSQQLAQLQKQNVRAVGGGNATCVDLSGANVILEADEAAWVVLQFADAGDSLLTAVSADPEAATDHPCDFLTRDRGDLWYRPDPVSSPFDWKFTVFQAVMPSKQTLVWTHLKTLYR